MPEAERKSITLKSYLQYKLKLEVGPDYRQKELERKRPLSRKFYWDNRDYVLNQSREVYYADVESSRTSVRDRLKKFRDLHPERNKQLQKDWRDNNKDKIAANNSYQNAVRRSGRDLGFVEASHFAWLESWQGLRCYYCNSDISGYSEKEHIIPITKGGLHSADNLVLACKACNGPSNKWTKYLQLEWEPRITQILNSEMYSDEILETFGFEACKVYSSFLSSTRNLGDYAAHWMEVEDLGCAYFLHFEWEHRRSAIENSLWSSLGHPIRRTFARNTEIEEITKDEAEQFLESYHIQGFKASSIYLGLRDRDGVIVGVSNWTLRDLRLNWINSLSTDLFRGDSLKCSNFLHRICARKEVRLSPIAIPDMQRMKDHPI